MNKNQWHPRPRLDVDGILAGPACDHLQIAESNSTDRPPSLTKEGSIYGDIKLLLG